METLDKHFRELTRAAFARYGFAYADVIARWPEIVGEDLAGQCRPERIKWPRGADTSGGTLVITAAPGRALELQYEVPRIIERINAFYGHAALAAVRIVASATALSKPVGRSLRTDNFIPDQSLEDITDDGLKAALIRLGRGVAGTDSGSPQGK